MPSTATVKLSVKDLDLVMRGLARELGPPVLRTEAERELVERLLAAARRIST